jgi:hypothetical protein
MAIDFDRGRSKRDERLRRRILFTLNLARGISPTGGLSGQRLMDETDGEISVSDSGYESANHFMQLCRDLRNHQLVTELTNNNRRRGQAFGPEHVSYRITAKGTQLIEEQIPPIAGIDDDRIVES